MKLELPPLSLLTICLSILAFMQDMTKETAREEKTSCFVLSVKTATSSLFRIRLTVKKMLKVCPIWKITMHGLPPKNCWKMRPLASFLYTQQDARLMAFIVTPMLATHILSTMMISVRPKFSSSTELQMITVSGLLMKSISL